MGAADSGKGGASGLRDPLWNVLELRGGCGGGECVCRRIHDEMVPLGVARFGGGGAVVGGEVAGEVERENEAVLVEEGAAHVRAQGRDKCLHIQNHF